MTLIELMVGITIVAILFALAAPSFSNWIQNTHIRTAAEAMQNGLILARAEAVRRNTNIRFQLTDTLNNSCALTTTGTNWVVSMDDPTGACATPIADPSDPAPVAPRIIQFRPGGAGSKNALVVADQSPIIFNGLGRRSVPGLASGDININITNPIGGNCLPALPAVPAAGETMTCLRIVVSPGGQVRMCNPRFASPDPQGC
jgi:type IV fimbrial biogenesis protein FimT